MFAAVPVLLRAGLLREYFLVAHVRGCVPEALEQVRSRPVHTRGTGTPGQGVAYDVRTIFFFAWTRRCPAAAWPSPPPRATFCWASTTQVH